MKKNAEERRPVVLSVNLEHMIKKAEKHPKPNSCVVVDVLTELLSLGHTEWEKKYHPHKRQKTNK